jgi:hypothetical protein
MNPAPYLVAWRSPALHPRLRCCTAAPVCASRPRSPVFGILKSVMDFRQFLLRGLDCVRGEWSLITMAWNIKQMHALSLG